MNTDILYSDRDSAIDDKTNTPPHLEHRLMLNIIVGLFSDRSLQWRQL